MPTASLPGNELWERVKGLFQEKEKLEPPRWSHVDPKVVQTFTFIQIICLAAMFWIKESRVGVLFPVVIAMLAPIRFALERRNMISTEDMDVLDAE